MITCGNYIKRGKMTCHVVAFGDPCREPSMLLSTSQLPLLPLSVCQFLICQNEDSSFPLLGELVRVKCFNTMEMWQTLGSSCLMLTHSHFTCYS